MKTKFFLSFVIAAMISLFAAAYVQAAGKEIVSMKAHSKAGLTCESCHQTTNVIDGCLKCHANSGGTYRGQLDKSGNGIEKEYPESGKTRMAATHDSHGGPIRCTVCHASHIEPPKLYCNNCHQFDVKIK
jgi:hypothetical protein